MTAPYHTLYLHPAGATLASGLGRRADRAELELTAHRLAEALDGRRFPAKGTDRYWHLILRNPQMEAWLIVWPPDTGIDLHDHGDSEGAVALIGGALTERFLQCGGGGFELANRLLGAGDVIHLPAGLVHAVANEGDDVAVSVHVYSPRLSEMTYHYLGDQDSRASTSRYAVALP